MKGAVLLGEKKKKSSESTIIFLYKCVAFQLCPRARTEYTLPSLKNIASC